jgi:hypothetical protein
MKSTVIDTIISKYLKRRWNRILKIREESTPLQYRILQQILQLNKNTGYGNKFQFKNIRSRNQYAAEVPVVNYSDLKEYIDKMMLGYTNILVPGEVKWYAKSSGTTSARSKYIPVTNKYFYGNIIRSCWDVTSIIYANRPDAGLFRHKSLIMGGSLSSFPENFNVTIGDISAIMIDRLPWIGRPFYSPDFETALLEDWEEKIEIMSRQCLHENVVLFGGVPTWNIVLFNKLLEISGKKNIAEIWPNVHTYLHGGVGFKPYKKQFDQYIGKKDFDYYEVYNATEGYFSVQDFPDSEGMLLLTDNGIYYEFIPMEEWGKETPETILLEDVEIDKNYAIVISNFGGLYRYMPGDTVNFTSKNPYRLRVSGRTKHFINVFGEEVIVDNTDQALTLTCKDIPAIVREYTVGPIHLSQEQKGSHQWLVEFEKKPANMDKFTFLLDQNLRKVNSDYDAKRYKSLALEQLSIKVLPEGTFHKWLKSKGKYGGQNKVPRLSNNRLYVDELLELIKS